MLLLSSLSGMPLIHRFYLFLTLYSSRAVTSSLLLFYITVFSSFSSLVCLVSVSSIFFSDFLYFHGICPAVVHSPLFCYSSVSFASSFSLCFLYFMHLCFCDRLPLVGVPRLGVTTWSLHSPSLDLALSSFFFSIFLIIPLHCSPRTRRPQVKQ